MRKVMAGVMLAAGWLLADLQGAERVIISEFMARNDAGISDEDGERSDWIEIFNTDNQTVNLGGWFLTDNASRLNKWSFPATNLPPGRTLLVWASDKNRRVAGAPLHTNFKLDANPGEYLALVRPDLSIASQYTPAYPPQAPDVSFGLPTVLATNALLAPGAPARYKVPADWLSDLNWQEPAFNDSTWSNANTGLGFTAQTSPDWLLLADSLADFSGLQGSNGWFYGYYNKSADAVPGYVAADFIPFPTAGVGWSSSNYWTGTNWDYYGANPPYTTINNLQCHPNGTNNAAEHWVIRRWQSPVSGLLRVDWWVAKQNLTCGNGVTGTIFHNGTNKAFVVVAANNGVGATNTLYLTNVAVGDTVELAISPVGTDGSGADSCDGSYSRLWIYEASWLTNFIGADVAAQMRSNNASLYLRAPFTVANPGAVSRLLLRARYDDGFVAYLNGQEVARRNAPMALPGGVVAGSTNDWDGVQGNNGWFYGIYNQSADVNGVFDYVTDFSLTASDWSFDGTAWTLGEGDPPYTMIGYANCQPNGTNNFSNLWPIRRWVSEISGVVTARVHFAKAVANGGGATLRVYFNGNPLMTRTIAGNDIVGFVTNLVVAGVDPGDTFDFAVDPLGSDGQTSDVGDLCFFDVVLATGPSGDPTWNSTATAAATLLEAHRGDLIDITEFRHFLNAETNWLAVHGLNVHSNDADFLLLPEVLGVTAQVDTNQGVYFASPTPNAINGAGATNLGPVIVDMNFSPSSPLSNQAITVTARLAPTFNPAAGLTLAYRVMFSNEVTVSMFDDGAHGDGAAGDGVWGGAIPAGIAQPGQMIRWYLQSTDTLGITMRSPAFADPFNSPQYFGTVVADPAIVTKMPVFHWFVENPSGANAKTGARCSVYFKGQFLDNILANLHGQSSSGFPKKSYNFDANPGHKLVWDPNAPPVSDWAILTTWADRAFFRNLLTADQYAWSEVPAHASFAVRVHQNGSYFYLGNFIDGADEELLERLGMDPNGALYKMYNHGYPTNVTQNEKKTRKQEGYYDLLVLENAVTQGDVNARIDYVYDHYNLPGVVNFLAAKAIPNDHDCCHKNYYVYRDSDGTGEWTALPWDMDLTWGHVFNGSAGGYFNDPISTNTYNSFYGQSASFFAVLWNDPTLKSMWTRRGRTLMDKILQPPGTPASNDFLRAQMDAYEELVRIEAALDLAKWGSATWTPPVSPPRDLTNETARIKDIYLPGRRAFLFVDRVNAGEIPASQPANVVLQLGAVDYNPISANQKEEFIEIINTNSFAVDITGWRLSGAVNFRFAGGTVVPAGARVFVSPDVKAFRARAISPKAGERRFVVGPYEGQLSARGETIVLSDDGGRLVATNAYPGNPSPAQQYLRITEIMYNPAPVAGDTNAAQAYEYLELRNTATDTALDLRGVRLVNGVQFDFGLGALTNLGPGERVLVVKDLAAFTLRYGPGLPVAGVYTGSLDNAGERIQLLDGSNEEILDFSYNNSWYPLTDGLGFSLAVVDEQAEPDAWDRKSNWRANGTAGGTPGQANPPLPAVAPVVINEVLAHTDPPDEDAVELYNPTDAPVAIGGWFLTDDLAAPKKYRIPDGVVLGAGAYAVFRESEFNAGGQGFGLSSTGEEVWLLSGDGATNLTGYYHGVEFGATDNGVSLGREVNSLGEEDWAAQAAVSLGTNNAGPRVGPVVVSEIMYHPVALTTNDPPGAYVELRNVGATNVALYHPAEPTNTWRLREAVDYDFPAGVELPPGGGLLVVGFDPLTNGAALAAFRQRYGVGLEVPVYGPWRGSLPNDQGVVKLQKPDRANTNGVPYVEVERVRYRDGGGWPELADGRGAALGRVGLMGYWNEPTNWAAVYPSPGGSLAGGGAPAIVSAPAGGSVAEGQPLNLNVGVSGAGPFYYQWWKDGRVLAGATNASYAVGSAQKGDAGWYEVVVLGGGGSAVSAGALVEVWAPLVLVGSPTNVTVFPGQPVNLAVTVTGDAPAYQWWFGGLPVDGATNAVLTVGSAQPGDAGDYRVVATNPVSAVTSAVAVVAVRLQPLITQSPQSQSVFGGSNVVFGVVAVSSTPLRYQWWWNGQALTGETNATLGLPNVQEGQAGTYWVEVRDDYGLAVSPAALLEVKVRPAFVQLPAPTNQVVYAGEAAGLTARASGTLPITYRWRKNGLTILTNATVMALEHTLVLAPVAHAQAGRYDVVLTNQYGTTSSNVFAYLTVMDRLTNRTVPPGSNAVFTLVATTSSGTVPANLVLRHQWWKDGTNLLAGATNATLTITNAQAADAGIYSVRASNDVGTVVTQSVRLAVGTEPVEIVAQPQSATVFPAQETNLTVGVTGEAPVFQWWFAGNPLPGANEPSLTLSQIQPSQAGDYWVVVTNAVSSVTSEVARLTVRLQPLITAQPQSLSVWAGTNVEFAVTAVSSTPLRYQWWLGTNQLPAETNATLVITNAQEIHAGSYWVEVQDDYGSTPSAEALLEVKAKPAFVSLPFPANQVVYAGEPAALTAQASGTLPITYRWRKNGLTILTSATVMAHEHAFEWAAVAHTNAGRYDVVLTNQYGTTSSNVFAYLTVMERLTNETVRAGSNAVFTLVATTHAPGTVPANMVLNYQWWKDATNLLAGATNATLAITNARTSDAGLYTIIATNEVGTVVSQAVTLVVETNDADNDGMPDDWEALHGVDDPNADADGDGMTNLQEYLAGTNPQQAGSRLALSGLVYPPGAGQPLVIQFDGVAGRSYAVRWRESLASGQWQVLTNIGPLSSDGPVVVNDGVAGANRQKYFQVIIPGN